MECPHPLLLYRIDPTFFFIEEPPGKCYTKKSSFGDTQVAKRTTLKKSKICNFAFSPSLCFIPKEYVSESSASTQPLAPECCLCGPLEGLVHCPEEDQSVTCYAREVTDRSNKLDKLDGLDDPRHFRFPSAGRTNQQRCWLAACGQPMQFPLRKPLAAPLRAVHGPSTAT